MSIVLLFCTKYTKYNFFYYTNGHYFALFVEKMLYFFGEKTLTIFFIKIYWYNFWL